MARITVVTGAHLCRNPRVVKEASALAAEGYDVTVLGPAWDEGLSAQDAVLAEQGGFEHQVEVDLRPSAGWGRHRHRLVRRAAVEATSRLGWRRPEALGYGVRTLTAAALRLRADLTIGHQEVGLWVTYTLLKAGRPVGFDLEDWHSRDQLAEGPRRPFDLLRRAEGEVLRGGAHVTTTSRALANAVAEAYGAPAPAVVYNAFPWSDRDDLDHLHKDRRDRSRPSLHWVSQTTGPGRGIDALFEALRLVREGVDVHLRGHADPEARGWLNDSFPSETGHRLFLHGLVPPGELLSRIAEHDIGLALEWTAEPSRDLTVTNKVLHYLLGGLAVVATETAGQREVAAAAPGALALCGPGDPVDIARALNETLMDRERLRAAKDASLTAARDRFCWEKNLPTLLASVAAALEGDRRFRAPSGLAAR